MFYHPVRLMRLSLIGET